MILKKLQIASSTLLITTAILQSGITYADDSEVFFGSEQFSDIAKPNIIFLLDYSTSMRDVNMSGTSIRRIEGLRDAVSETLLNTSLTGVRVGAMKYPDQTVGNDPTVGKAAKLVYPVVDIDQRSDGLPPETSSRADSSGDDAHQATINGTRKNVSIDSNVMVMGNLKADYPGIERIFDLDIDRYNTLFLLPRTESGASYDSYTYSNAISYVCSLILDDDAENCKPSIFNTTGTGERKRNHIIEDEPINGETQKVITGLNGTGYSQTGYGDQALFIFKGVNIPDDATITKAHLIITPKTDGFYKSNGNSFCSLSNYGAKGQAEWINWRVASVRNFPAPNTDTLLYNTTDKTSNLNFLLRTGAWDYAPRYYGIRQNETTYNNNPGGDASSNWGYGAPQDGATCWWQKDKKITVNITTTIQKSLDISKTDTTGSSTYVNNFKSVAALNGAPMADLVIRFWTGGGTAYSKPYHTIGAGAPKLKLTYTSSQTGSSNAAVRFNNVYIPQGATITNAKIKLVPAGGNDQSVTLRITGQKSGDPSAFKATADDFSTRARTSAFKDWPINKIWKTNAGETEAEKYEVTPDISNVLQEMVGSTDWCGGQSLAFFIDHRSGDGSRSAFTYDEAPGYRPILEFTYTGGETGCMTSAWEETLATRSADGYQVKGNNSTILSGNILYGYNNHLSAGYFANVLLKNPEDVGTASVDNRGLVSAILQLVPNNNGGGVIRISLDNTLNASRLKAARNNIGERQLLNVAGGDNKEAGSTTCTIPKSSSGVPVLCDISNLIRTKIQQQVNDHLKWENGNAIVVVIERISGDAMQFKPYDTGYSNAMRIKIIARRELMAPNSLTVRRRIVDAINAEEPTVPQTPTMPAMLDAARYITNIAGTAPIGPYQGTFNWNGKPQPSPLLSSCQMTHLILMSDGEANVNGSNWRKALASYTSKPWPIGRVGASECEYGGRQDRSGSEACGQALVNFMSTINQGDNKDSRENWVTTHAVAFGSKGAGTFLERLVNAGDKYNRGRYFYATTSSELVDAFMDIMDTAKGTYYTYASGQVAVSNTNNLDQRREIYYSLMEPSNRNHWSGNMKRFGLYYKPTSDGKKRAILVDAKGAEAVYKDINGVYFIDAGATSWWYTQGVNEEDGGNVHMGGVLDQLANDPAQRAMYVMKDTAKFTFDAKSVAASGGSKITPDDVETPEEEGVNAVDKTKGYVNYLRGYVFDNTGEASIDTAIPKKDLRLGDFAHSAVTFLTYNQCKVAGQEDASIVDCDSANEDGNPKYLGDGLEQIALLAGNDGFFRAFDVRSGQQVYAVIPNEMLPLLPKLQIRETIGLDVARLYGLDGTISIFHDDTDNNGYINGNERVIAYVSTGRGGRAIYAIDVTNPTAPTLKWKKVVDQGVAEAGFEKLGYTWSTPVTGKMRWNSTVRNVVIFGGGYDPEQDDTEVRKTDTMGNAIYILDAFTGDIIWSADQTKYSAMQYSIPSQVAVYKADKDNEGNDLITDIFVGDMGGQLWRFHIDINGILSAAGDKGVVAKIGAGDNRALAQRIYMPPAIWAFDAAGYKGKLSVNIGTGYLGHPLVTYNQDQFYSFRFDVVPDAGQNKALEEESLYPITSTTIEQIAKGELDLSADSKFQKSGFRINFGSGSAAAGEKMISSALASFDSVMFNTYIPDPDNKRTCRLASGSQRSYSINLLTGESYFDGLYRTSNVIGIPPGVAMYCDSSSCTTVHNFEDLSSEGSSHIFDRTPPTQGYIKTGWTDLFDLAPTN